MTRENILNLFSALGVMIGLLAGAIFINYYTTRYSMNAIVIGIEGDAVLIEDDTNNLWEFSGNGYKINDVVAVKFYTNHTDNIREDDEIEKVDILYHYDD